MKLGTTEIILIVVIILLVFGSSLIPRIKKMVKKSKDSFKEGQSEK